jgi:hypothetical protein
MMPLSRPNLKMVVKIGFHAGIRHSWTDEREGNSAANIIYLLLLDPVMVIQMITRCWVLEWCIRWPSPASFTSTKDYRRYPLSMNTSKVEDILAAWLGDVMMLWSFLPFEIIMLSNKNSQKNLPLLNAKPYNFHMLNIHLKFTLCQYNC